MPVGFVAFELSFLSKAFRRRLKANFQLDEVRKRWNKFLKKARPSTVTVLLLSVIAYLVLSRSGPFLTKVGETTVEKFHLDAPLVEIIDPVGLQSLKEAFRGFTRVPGPISSHRSFSVILYIMGNSNAKKADDTQPAKDGSSSKSESEAREEGTNTKEYVKYCDIEKEIKTGSLAILKRAGQDIRHYAIFIQFSKCSEEFPTMLVKGKTKPMQSFDPKIPRHAHLVTAANRIFYGDYEEVSVRYLKDDVVFDCSEVSQFVDQIPSIQFSDTEKAVIGKASSPAERSSLVCTFMVAQFYKLLKVLKTDPDNITPDNLEEYLNLEPPKYIELPKVKEGPMTTGDPPFLSKLVDGIFPPPEIQTQPLSNLLPKLNTGDIVLFSGATSSGAIIKFFDHSEFSHCGIVVRTEYSPQALIWEASTNKAGLVDVETGTVRRGVELLPLRSKVFSGWYNRVAIRRLVDIDEEKRKEIYSGLMKLRLELQGTPYEKSNVELALSALDFQEEYLSFLRNTKEDISSLFCSELVALAYKKLGLLDTQKLSNEFTPDEFSSKNDSKLKLAVGRLEKEEYIELKFDLYDDGTGTMERRP